MANAHPTGKNIVVCCDGTGNEVTGDLSNVLKLFRIIQKGPDQRVFYHPGVGTIGTEDDWSRRWTQLRAAWGLATGAGLDDNILDAYRYLVETYEEGDRIFLFGFSRGAYTVRALAAFIHMVGLLWPDQANLSDYALTTYKRTGWRLERREELNGPKSGAQGASAVADGSATQHGDPFRAAWDFGRITSARHVSIHFVGVWDTVASMIARRPDRLGIPTLRTLPYTRKNPSVRAFRHAIALDERRRMFRLNRWAPDQDFVVDPFSKPPTKVKQDSRQVWFSGVHADVGGGYAESQSGLAKIPLEWMIQEALPHGLLINTERYDRLVLGKPEPDGSRKYVEPAATAQLHTSLKGFWRLLEILPKSTRWREWHKWSLLGFYLPLGEPRVIQDGEAVHKSVGKRLAADTVRPPYVAINLTLRGTPPPESRWAPWMRRVALLLLVLVLVASFCGLHGAWRRHHPHLHDGIGCLEE